MYFYEYITSDQDDLLFGDRRSSHFERTLLTHEEQYTLEQFRGMCDACLPAALTLYALQHREQPTAGAVHTLLMDALCGQFGFTRVWPELIYACSYYAPLLSQGVCCDGCGARVEDSVRVGVGRGSDWNFCDACRNGLLVRLKRAELEHTPIGEFRGAPMPIFPLRKRRRKWKLSMARARYWCARRLRRWAYELENYSFRSR